jgi:hypothetical protein
MIHMHDTYACVYTLYVHIYMCMIHMHIYICMIHMHAAKPDKISSYAQSQHRPNVMDDTYACIHMHDTYAYIHMHDTYA